MNQKNKLFWDECSGSSRFNTFLVNGTLIDPGIIGFDIDLPAFAKFIRKENLARIERIVISHGHFDHWNHIGILGQMSKIPIYMGALTQALILRSAKFDGEMTLFEIAKRASFVNPGDTIEDEIKTFALPHSIPQTMGFVIPGKHGSFVFLGDFRLSGFTQEDREKTLDMLRKIGRQGVDIVALNIFNAHLPGETPFEQLAIEELTRIIAEASGKVVITCFSTNLSRIWRICQVAKNLGRPVEFFGSAMQYTRSILDFVNVSTDWNKAVYLVTGCQAESGSVLDVLAQEAAQGMPCFGKQNILVYSSRCIPGNEKALRDNIRTLRPCFGRIIVNYGDVEQIGLKQLDVEERLTHVSGHAYAGDIRETLDFLRPKRVLPWPQISPQIESFRNMAQDLGIEVIPEENRVIDI